MFRLFEGLIRSFFTKQEYNVLLLGPKGTGKTTLLEQLKCISAGKAFNADKVRPTVGQNMGHFANESVSLVLWDLSGDVEFQPLWPKYYPETHLVCFVIDASSDVAVDAGLHVLSQVLAAPALQHKPVLVLVNKGDIAQVSMQFIRDAVATMEPRQTVLFHALSALAGDGTRECLRIMFDEPAGHDL